MARRNASNIKACSRFWSSGIKSEDQPLLDWLDHFFLVNAEPFHEPAELLRGQFLQFLSCPRPLVLATLEPFIQENVSICIPIQGLDSVGSSSAEDEQGVGLRVHVESVLNNRSKSIDTASEITVAYRNIDFLGLGDIKHRGSPPGEQC